MTLWEPFAPGPFPAEAVSLVRRDSGRNRNFPIEIWRPARSAEPLPLIVFSHAAGQGRTSAAYLGEHLASHGYAVAAMDHSEVVVSDLARPPSESPDERSRRWRQVIESRVPDLRFLVDELLGRAGSVDVDPARIGAAGHSFGGWTVLAAVESDPRIRSVVALAPAGASDPRPGILPATLSFRWARDVPTLYLAAENDASTPLPGILGLFDRTPATKRMVILRRADHLHFLDDAEGWHERFRTMPAPPELAAMQREMRPIAELHTAAQAHAFAAGLTLAHFDATLRRRDDAARFLDGDVASALRRIGVDADVHR